MRSGDLRPVLRGLCLRELFDCIVKSLHDLSLWGLFDGKLGFVGQLRAG